MPLSLQEDSWLQNILKFPCFNLHYGGLPHFALKIPRITASEPFLVTCKVPISINKTKYLETGFKFINNLETYEFNNSLPTLIQSCRYHVRRYEIEDLNEVLRITSGAFTYSRFHQDERIKFEVAEEIKRHWILANLGTRMNVDTFVITNIDNDKTPLGYVSFLVSESTLIIDLIAVSKNHRGKGLGRQLVSRVLTEANYRRLNVRVGTQSDNPAVNLYSTLGFSRTSIESVFHYINEGTL